MSNGHMLLNKAAVRAYLKRRQPEIRPGWSFKYVSDLIYNDVNARVQRILDSSLKSHPSTGTTFRQIM